MLNRFTQCLYCDRFSWGCFFRKGDRFFWDSILIQFTIENMDGNLLEEIKKAWQWTGIQPNKIVLENDFGNLIIEDVEKRYWRLCPEDSYCEIIAENNQELNKLLKDEEFLLDWNMQTLVDIAREKLGLLQPGQKYHMVIPGVVGGKYDISNIKIISQNEQISFSGDFAQQIKDLPNGATIKLKFT